MNFFNTPSHTDVNNIDTVINYDFPNYTEDYVHRIGRTARAEKTGTAYTFFTSESDKQADELVKVLRNAKQEINPQLLQFVKQPQNRFMESEYIIPYYPIGGCKWLFLQEMDISEHVTGTDHVILVHVIRIQTEVTESINCTCCSFTIVITYCYLFCA